LIFNKIRICANQSHILDNRLRNQQSVKRVFVVKRQIFKIQGVRKFNGQNLQIISTAFFNNHIFERAAKTEFTEFDFDLKFLHSSNTQKYLICRIENFGRSFDGKFVWLFVHPDECVGI